MAFTKDDLANIDEVIACADLTVKVNGREITYRSTSDLMKARRLIIRDLARQAGCRSQPLAGIVTHVDRGIR